MNMGPITSAQTIRNRRAAAQKAQRLSADRRQCPSCQRRGALVRDTEKRMTYCRWTLQNRDGYPYCDYVEVWNF